MTLTAFGAHTRCEYKGANLFLCHDCGIVHVEEWLRKYRCRRSERLTADTTGAVILPSTAYAEALATVVAVDRRALTTRRRDRQPTREVWRDREDDGRERWNPPR